ncbi:MAG: hypothetical protein ABN480_07045 [Dickeya sp.]
MDNILSEIFFDDGKRAVVIDQLGMKGMYGNAECSRNLYLLDKNGNVIWRVNSDFDGDGNVSTPVLVPYTF